MNLQSVGHGNGERRKEEPNSLRMGRKGEKVKSEQTLSIAEQLLSSIGSGTDPDVIAMQFSADVQFEIPGDVGVLPWIGRKTGRAAASDFFHDVRRMTERIHFDVLGVFADKDRAVIVGEFASRVIATGKTIESPFAIILTIAGGEITRFQMLEDSFAVSRAARS